MSEQHTFRQTQSLEEITQLSDTHQIPFYILLTLDDNKILTGPRRNLLQGKRNGVVTFESNAVQIASHHGLSTKARGPLVLPAEQNIRAHSFVVKLACGAITPYYADFTVRPHQSPHHTRPYELHDPEELLEDFEQLVGTEPKRRVDIAIVEAFGAFALSHR